VFRPDSLFSFFLAFVNQLIVALFFRFRRSRTELDHHFVIGSYFQHEDETSRVTFCEIALPLYGIKPTPLKKFKTFRTGIKTKFPKMSKRLMESLRNLVTEYGRQFS